MESLSLRRNSRSAPVHGMRLSFTETKMEKYDIGLVDLKCKNNRLDVAQSCLKQYEEGEAYGGVDLLL
jgi:hypothetical protein